MKSSQSQENDFTGNRRKKKDRRKKSSQGFTYFTTVGWICRREVSRRQSDKVTYFL